ncbi:hypothetical protein DL768_002839 [Monosporascus sp. mg162]|nr:hypothetical protein DL768_002839 [Monosporascus sp. mg162]
MQEPEKQEQPKTEEEPEKPKEMKSELVLLSKKYDVDGKKVYGERKNNPDKGRTSDGDSTLWPRRAATTMTAAANHRVRAASVLRILLLDGMGRGRTFERLTGQQFRHYNGVDTQKSVNGCNRLDRFYVNGRVVIDCKTYYQWGLDYGFEVEDLLTQKPSTASVPCSLEEDLLVTSPTVRGFDFTARRFLRFFMDNLSPIEWDEICFDQLVPDPDSEADSASASIDAVTPRSG